MSVVDDVSLTVSMDHESLRSGESVTFTATLRNGRSTALAYGVSGCGFGTATLSVPLPLLPKGKTWEGQAAWFKEFALTKGYGPGGVSATAPLDIALAGAGSACSNDGLEMSLGPGQKLSETFTWRAELVPGVGVLPGDLALHVSAGFDRQNDPPSYDPGYTGIRGNWFPIYKQVAVTGHVAIVGEAPKILTAGQAIDALLADSRFDGWLQRQSPQSCDTANLFLQNNANGGLVPAGPGWEIELFCEVGMPRHFAITLVDAVTGEVRLVDICDDPCSR